MVETDSWESWGLPCVAVGPVLGPLSLRGLVIHCAGGRGGRGVLWVMVLWRVGLVRPASSATLERAGKWTANSAPVLSSPQRNLRFPHPNTRQPLFYFFSLYTYQIWPLIEMGLYDIQSLCPASWLSVGFLRVIHVVMVSVLHSFYRQILVAFHWMDRPLAACLVDIGLFSLWAVRSDALWINFLYT